ncbi:MAG: UDP-N-acetylmuramoyl-L-alanyl-D-glutamate--2,6-diaminopimelate ligase [Chloroflexi bacterium]|nr:UDP-N-acetylmuramoyl-L-alanyl-D-glutamate--2,6-diaminopimelate ligase [Chloroflexota bacterium]
MPKPLADLLAHLPQAFELRGDADTPITAAVVEADTAVEPGGVFVARAGLTADGHDFIPRAIERGAAAIVGTHALTDLPVPYVRVTDAREAVGHLAAAYHDFPSRNLIVIGVTGTDGKTTTCTLIHSILRQAHPNKVGLISTVAADLGDRTQETGLHVTTPGAPQVQALLAQMVANGLRYAILEMTSHGLAQGRLNGVDVDLAVLTNLTHEHLDFHGTFAAYRAAKGRLFAMLGTSARKPGQPKISVINADDAHADFFAAFPADQTLHYGLDAAVVRGSAVDHRPHGTSFVVNRPGQTTPEIFALPLVGAFNVRNALAAITVGAALGINADDLRAGIAAAPPIPGRMERIDAGQDFLALVDFAHTPHALENALVTGQTLVGPGGRVIAVFGSAGLRDREKRRLMAEISARLADVTILTAEDPRTESLDAILDVMMAACVSAGGVEGATVFRVPDRGAALAYACQIARAGDVVLACGKGHEQSMCFGTTEYPWDDRAALRAALTGDPLRTLPTAAG